MMRDNYYDLLQVPHDASKADIKRAYRRLVRQVHPDINPTLPDAQERLRLAIEAYKVLADPATRASYDQVQRLFTAPYPMEVCTANQAPRLFVERKVTSIKALFVTVVLAAFVVYLCVALSSGRSGPLEWQSKATDFWSSHGKSAGDAEVSTFPYLDLRQEDIQIRPWNYTEFSYILNNQDTDGKFRHRGDYVLASGYQVVAGCTDSTGDCAKTLSKMQKSINPSTESL